MHEAIGGWIDEVIEMKKGAGLGGITGEIFKKRQEMMWKIVEHIIVELFTDELNRETMMCPNCGRVLNRRDIHERTVETMIGEITSRRPYFYCVNCKKVSTLSTRCPDLIRHRKAVRHVEAGASVATELPYNKAQEIFEELTGLSMSDHAMHDIVGDLCEEADVLDIAPSAEEIEEKVRTVSERKK